MQGAMGKLLLALGCSLCVLTAAPAYAQRPVGCPDEIESEIVDLLNAERARLGLAPVTIDVRLVEAARGHSEDMATYDFFSHSGSDGSDFSARITAAGYAWRAVGEIISAGYSTPADVVASWMGSTPHRATLLSAAYRHVGVGASYDVRTTFRLYYTADLGDSANGVLSPDDLCAAAPACSDGFDNDADGRADLADPDCGGVASQISEAPVAPACGLGFEIAPLLLLLGRLREPARRRSREAGLTSPSRKKADPERVASGSFRQ